MDKVLLTTITAVYRGEHYLRELALELAKVREELRRADAPVQLHQAIFVDDASIDGSAAVLEQLMKEYPWIRAITMSRNFGQHPALIAGMLQSDGDWIATLDEDLQHHPRHLMELLAAAVLGGKDIIYARPISGVHQSWYRDLGSRGFKALVSLLSGNPHVRSFNSYRMIRGSIARAAAKVMGHETYLDVVIGWFTRRVGTYPLDLQDHRYIATGISGYRLRSLLTHARRMLISSQVRLLRIGAVIGLLSLMLSFAMLIKAVADKLHFTQDTEVRGWASLFVGIFFFGGLGSVLTSVMLEYMSMLVLQAQGKPTSFVVDRSRDRLIEDYLRTKVRLPDTAGE